eukprot:TRINITY_DN138170_c0_g1_i1.p4 TRINITY_DN138170_c0_g1~~TRINITY_DN138170_c0_g1_i1.p4  ORF type:complete len:112 (-),score=2.63 TRINITY_DN138170_c0_g1_i1:223-558(-)
MDGRGTFLNRECSYWDFALQYLCMALKNTNCAEENIKRPLNTCKFHIPKRKLKEKATKKGLKILATPHHGKLYQITQRNQRLEGENFNFMKKKQRGKQQLQRNAEVFHERM